ncbi:O-antigen ligase family protein [Bacillus sp. B15-48]|uniref:O-antigen ligase family protein n=1 Tax=Bacillus sp. B15-48 TaxID=1548601 RepID=UPI00193EC9D9|nr:O-antigen ligase family protein [Bacillus sp. B15-48]
MDMTNDLSNQKYTYLEDKVKINFTMIGILVFTFSFVILKSFIPFQISYLLLLTSIVILLFSTLVFSKRGLVITRVDIMWFFFLMFFIINIAFNNIIRVGTVYAVFVYLLGICFLLLVKVDINYYKYPLKIISLMGFFYAISSIFQYSFTSIYTSNILPLFNPDEQNEILTLMRRGGYTGFTNQTAHLAGYVLSAIGVFIFSNWKVKFSTKLYYFLCLIILFIALLLTAKRAHLIFMVVALLITALFSLNNKKMVKGISKLTITIFSVIFLVILLYNSINFQEDSAIVGFVNELEESLVGLVEGEDISSGRSVLFARSWELFKENPIMGIGWNEFFNNSLGLINTDRGSHPHNIYLQLLAEFGLFGFLFFMLPVLYMYYKTFQMLRSFSMENESLQKWKSGIQFSFFSQSFFLLYGLTGNGLTDYNFLLWYFFACSISLSAMVLVKSSKKKQVKKTDSGNSF